MHVVVQCKFDIHKVYILCTKGVTVLCIIVKYEVSEYMWCKYGVHSVYIYCTFGVNVVSNVVVYMWCTCFVQVVYMWCKLERVLHYEN